MKPFLSVEADELKKLIGSSSVYISNSLKYFILSEKEDRLREELMGLTDLESILAMFWVANLVYDRYSLLSEEQLYAETDIRRLLKNVGDESEKYLLDINDMVGVLGYVRTYRSVLFAGGIRQLTAATEEAIPSQEEAIPSREEAIPPPPPSPPPSRENESKVANDSPSQSEESEEQGKDIPTTSTETAPISDNDNAVTVTDNDVTVTDNAVDRDDNGFDEEEADGNGGNFYPEADGNGGDDDVDADDENEFDNDEELLNELEIVELDPAFPELLRLLDAGTLPDSLPPDVENLVSKLKDDHENLYSFLQDAENRKFLESNQEGGTNKDTDGPKKLVPVKSKYTVLQAGGASRLS